MAGTNPIVSGCGFHHVAIRVVDFERTLKFYTEALGFRKAVEWGEGERRACMLDTGDGNYLEVFAGAKRAPGEPAPEGAIIHFALRTDDCDAALERARAAGAQVTMEPKDLAVFGDPPIPIRIAFFKGPDGEVVELFQNQVL
jgi:catechol 2,3-dioxygenase-like lactoylglutathione lyase family enzyme